MYLTDTFQQSTKSSELIRWHDVCLILRYSTCRDFRYITFSHQSTGRMRIIWNLFILIRFVVQVEFPIENSNYKRFGLRK